MIYNSIMKEILIRTISKSLKTLSKKRYILFNYNFLSLKDYSDLSEKLVLNSSLIYKILYFINSSLINFLENLPSNLSKFLFKKLINPRINPISKIYLFLIYHHGFK